MTDRAPPPPPVVPPRTSPRRRRLLFAGLAVLLPLVALVVASSLVPRALGWMPFRQASGAMRPTLARDEFIFIDTRAYQGARQPAYGDLVAVDVPGEVLGMRGALPAYTIIKRVVGLPGDRINIVDGVVWVNGKALAQQKLGEVDGLRPGRGWAKALKLSEQAPNGATYEILRQPGVADSDGGPFTVPPGHFFILGDNRDDSLDSRFWARRNWYLPASNVKGAATWVYWGGLDHLDRIGTALK